MKKQENNLEEVKQEKVNKEKGNKNKKPIEVNFTIVAIILIAILCVSVTPVTFQNDTFYTIKIGEYIKNYGIDMMDNFSWHSDLSYTYPHWLYDLCTYLVYSIANFKGIYILTCILSAILGVSIFLVNSKLTKSKSISFIITVCAMYMLQDYITARAQLVTFILFIWEIYCIEKFIENKKIIYVISLMIISLLITNLHVATWPFFFVLFIPYMAEYFICVISDIIFYDKIGTFIVKHKIKILENKKKNKEKYEEKIEKLEEKLNNIEIRVSKIKIKREEERQNAYKVIINKNNNVKFLIIIMIICALMGLLTPIGDTPYTYLSKTMQGNTTKNISEHLPLTLANNTDIICMILTFLGLLMFTKTKIRLCDLFMLSGLCYLMFSTRRQTSMFALISSVILTRMIVDLIKKNTENGLEEAEKTAKNIGVVIALTGLMLFVSCDTIKPKFDDEFVSKKSYPVAACDYILENINLENVKFYNEYNFGSYMVFRGIPVFIDSRADLYTPEFNDGDDIFTDFINTSSISKFYEETFEKYNITHLIITKGSKTNLIITKTKDKNYKELYSDDDFVVYERLNAKK